MTRTLILAALLAACAGCAQPSNPTARAPLTERQRDSLIARSRLPNASAVGRAMTVSDRASNQAAETNAAVDSLFR